MRNALAAIAALTFATTLAAAPPQLTHGQVQAMGGGGPLQSRVESVSGWVGWAIPAQDAREITCCDNWNGGGCSSCRLDGSNMNITSNDHDGLHVAVDHYNLFARVSEHRVDRIRIFSANCNLDASGNTVYWMDDVKPADSVALLRSLASGSGTEKGRDNALMALAFHAGGTDALIDAARHGTHETRGKALFWLSQQASEKATATLKDAVENDPDDDVRGKAVFGISQLPDDRSIPLLIELTNHRSRTVRKKAIFWLGQKNDPRALAAIEDILKR